MLAESNDLFSIKLTFDESLQESHRQLDTLLGVVLGLFSKKGESLKFLIKCLH